MPPFKDMFLSLPVWALLLAHMGNNWGMYTLLTEMPTYLTSVHHFDISSVRFEGIFRNSFRFSYLLLDFLQSGLLSALPYFLMWTFSIFCGLLASRLRSQEVRSDVIRKSFNTIGHLGPALALIGLSFSGCNRSLVIFWFCLAVMLNGAANSGFQVKNQITFSCLKRNGVSWPFGFTDSLRKAPLWLGLYISLGIYLAT